MTQETLVALCTIGGTVGGALGAAFGFWVTIKVTIAVQGVKIKAHESWIKSLRNTRHKHNGILQRHELQISHIEHVTGVIKK